jgi:hypothetical protein
MSKTLQPPNTTHRSMAKVGSRARREWEDLSQVPSLRQGKGLGCCRPLSKGGEAAGGLQLEDTLQT